MRNEGQGGGGSTMYAIVPTIMCSKSTQISCKQMYLIRVHTHTERERKIQLGGDTFVTYAASNI